MSAENLRAVSARVDERRDPRQQLVREKYFSLRPQPLERWLWGQGIPASAERVFWLHWQEGMKRGDWCSELSLKRVARDCLLDVSTVTRAYQWLVKAGCVRRTEAARDPANPFHQPNSVTEVRVPRDLLVEFHRHPTRGANRAAQPAPPDGSAANASDSPASTVVATCADPFAGLSGRERFNALSQLTRALSAAERRAYDDACRTRRAHMAFDDATALSPEQRGRVLQHLSAQATQRPTASIAAPDPVGTTRPPTPRTLSAFDAARLRRAIHGAASPADAPELLRQVAWSIETGALRRFSPQHAIHIALKKIRDGAWTRPNRMPPNWSRG